KLPITARIPIYRLVFKWSCMRRPCRPAPFFLREHDLHTPVASALASNLDHTDTTDLGDVLDVRSAARLQVDAGNLEQSNPAGAARRLHAHRFDQLRPRIEFFVSDPDGFRFNAAGDEQIRFALDFIRVEEAHVDIEIESALVRGDVAA